MPLSLASFQRTLESRSFRGKAFPIDILPSCRHPCIYDDPAKLQLEKLSLLKTWIPASAGMTPGWRIGLWDLTASLLLLHHNKLAPCLRRDKLREDDAGVWENVVAP